MPQGLDYIYREKPFMNEREYSVSEAVQLSGVPSHVLRYWEEELCLGIRRTSQGHRVYTDADLALFARVKELKDKGIQLKAIRTLLENETQGKAEDGFARQIREIEQAGEAHVDGYADNCKETYSGEVCDITPAGNAVDSLAQFEAILRRIIEDVVSEQNGKLEQSIVDILHDEGEELYERYCRLAMREAAAAGRDGHRKVPLLKRLRDRIFLGF